MLHHLISKSKLTPLSKSIKVLCLFDVILSIYAILPTRHTSGCQTYRMKGRFADLPCSSLLTAPRTSSNRTSLVCKHCRKDISDESSGRWAAKGPRGIEVQQPSLLATFLTEQKHFITMYKTRQCQSKHDKIKH